MTSPPSRGTMVMPNGPRPQSARPTVCVSKICTCDLPGVLPITNAAAPSPQRCPDFSSPSEEYRLLCSDATISALRERPDAKYAEAMSMASMKDEHAVDKYIARASASENSLCNTCAIVPIVSQGV